MIKNIIFDLGNVVLPAPNFKSIMNFNVEKEDALKLEQAIFKSKEWKALDRGEMTLEEAILLISDKEENKTNKELIINIMKNWWDFHKVSDETTFIAKKLKEKGYNLYVLSNMSKETYEYFKDNEFFTLIDGIVISGYINMIKPEKEIFEYILNKYNLIPEECLFIDDDDTYRSLDMANSLGINGRKVSPNDPKDIEKLLNENNIFIN